MPWIYDAISDRRLVFLRGGRRQAGTRRRRRVDRGRQILAVGESNLVPVAPFTEPAERKVKSAFLWTSQKFRSLYSSERFTSVLATSYNV